ncbi:MAG: flagellar motor protein MotB [Candidatus Omnitrophica bacterium]|nr:flagellar motor protein MotB [Candidatus Omnitrophota bacterium]
MRSKIVFVTIVAISCLGLSGCASLFKRKDSGKEIERLKAELERCLSEKEKEVSSLEKAKEELAKSLQKELGDYKAKLQMTERGLVITFLAEVFFDSGKDVIRTDGKESLQKVAQVLNKDVPDSNVAIEGHTDNDPIKYSSWKSNWELSSARALAVLHYFVDEAKVAPERLSANGYGEYKPVASNDNPAGKQQNRRVEIVILPSISKVKAEGK